MKVELRWLQQTSADVPAEDDWLCPAELQRLAQLRVPKRRADWRLGRWTAKLAVASWLNLSRDHACLGSIGVIPAETGAPRILLQDKPAGLAISLSHCAGVAICAITQPKVLVGCDLEKIEPRSPSFLQDYFTLEEQRLVSECDHPEEQAGVVTLIWSAKEAALKATETGLRSTTQSMSVRFDGNEPRDGAWRSLTVRSQSGGDFLGWWRRVEYLVQCFVTAPACTFPQELRPTIFSNKD